MGERCGDPLPGGGGRTQHGSRDDGGARELRPDERLLAACGGRAMEVTVLHEGLPRAATTEPRRRTAGTGVEIPDPNRADSEHFGGPAPDLLEGLVPHVSARDGHGDARLNIAVRADVASIVRRAARNLVKIGADRRDLASVGLPDTRVHGGILQYPKKLLPGNPQVERGGVPVVPRRDHGIKPARNPQPLGNGPDFPVLPHVLFHEGTVQPDPDPGILEQADAQEGPFERARDLGHPVVDGGISAVDADVHLTNAERFEPFRLGLRDQKRIRLQADVEVEPPCVLDQL